MPPPVAIKEEILSEPEDNDCTDQSDCRNHSDPRDQATTEDSDPPYKEDDNLEAPVIDSCEDTVVPPRDDNCDRSPPTLKRIVIKPSGRRSESDPESDLNMPSRKKLKFNNNVKSLDWIKVEKQGDWGGRTTTAPREKESGDWGRTVAPNKHSDKSELNDWSRTPKHSDTNNKDLDAKANHKFPLLTRETFHSDNSRIDDMVFDMSPMEIGGEDSRVVDMNPDFEPPVPRTEDPGDHLLYNSGRNNCADKYDFDLLACSDWTEEYQTGSDLIINDHPSDLDLSGLDGLDDPLDDPHIPNGNNDICYLIPKGGKRFLESAGQNSQVQSAIKSITDNRSYFDGADFHHLRHHAGHNSQGYGGGDVSQMGNASSHRGEHDLEEAVRSILL